MSPLSMEALNIAALSKNYNPHEIWLFAEYKMFSIFNGDIALKNSQFSIGANRWQY
jgi:hypothetical protein